VVIAFRQWTKRLVFLEIFRLVGSSRNALSQLGGGFADVGRVISGFAAGGVVVGRVAGIGEIIGGLKSAVDSATTAETAWAQLQQQFETHRPSMDEVKSSPRLATTLLKRHGQ